MTTQGGQGLSKGIWSVKGLLVKVPGVYRAYKWFTTRLGEGKVYRIHLGPMKGLKWRRYNRLPYWYHLGLYEPHVSELIGALLRPGDVFWDIGANAGYHTLMAARVVGRDGQVVAVEADPETAEILRDELALNACTNTDVLQVAVSDSDGSVEFARRPNNLQSSIAAVAPGGTTFEVKAARLDTLLQGRRRPNVIKMDIEGAEVWALPGAERLLSEDPRPILLLSVHGAKAADFCREFMRAKGYRFEEQEGFEQMWIARPGTRV